MSDLTRAIAERGPDKLLESVWRLRHYADELLYRAARDGEQPALATTEALHDELGKLEGLVVNMQTSCVRLPDPSRSMHGTWVVPIFTEPRPALSAYRYRDEMLLRDHRCFRLEFWRDGGGPTWKWRLHEREFDTGIPT